MEWQWNLLFAAIAPVKVTVSISMIFISVCGLNWAQYAFTCFVPYQCVWGNHTTIWRPPWCCGCAWANTSSCLFIQRPERRHQFPLWQRMGIFWGGGFLWRYPRRCCWEGYRAVACSAESAQSIGQSQRRSCKSRKTNGKSNKRSRQRQIPD